MCGSRGEVQRDNIALMYKQERKRRIQFDNDWVARMVLFVCRFNLFDAFYVC